MSINLRPYLIPFPFLFGIYPVFSLIANNISQMPLDDGLRALLFSIFLTAVIYILSAILLKNPVKAALLTTLFIFLIFSYGHLYEIVSDFTLLGHSLGRHRYLVFGYLVILISGTWLILRFVPLSSKLPFVLNIISVSLLIIPLYQIIYNQLETNAAFREVEEEVFINSSVSLPTNHPTPDIYYIIVDGYPRNDFMLQYLGLDNSGFLEYLKSNGFFVAECSQSNYTTTSSSMAATLNMRYLAENVGDNSGTIPKSAKLHAMIKKNEVQAIFSNLDYTIVTFDNGYPWLNWEGSDIRFDLAFEFSDLDFFRRSINDFEILFLGTTVVRFPLDLSLLPQLEQYVIPVSDWDIPGAPHQRKVFYMLDQLPAIPKSIQSPKFVYFHIVFPHPPFIVDADGKSLTDEPNDEFAAYADQIIYLNSRLMKTIDRILNESDTSPIIVIQSDHGASIDYESYGIDKANRLGILNAYFFPGDNYEDLYSTISPINTFRYILDKYFNGQYALLPDKSIVGKRGPYTTISCSQNSK